MTPPRKVLVLVAQAPDRALLYAFTEAAHDVALAIREHGKDWAKDDAQAYLDGMARANIISSLRTRHYVASIATAFGR